MTNQHWPMSHPEVQEALVAAQKKKIVENPQMELQSCSGQQ